LPGVRVREPSYGTAADFVAEKSADECTGDIEAVYHCTLAHDFGEEPALRWVQEFGIDCWGFGQEFNIAIFSI